MSIKSNLNRLFAVVLFSVCQFSCANTQEVLMPDVKLIQCSEPRPEVCTQHYQPVCGFEHDDNHKTFPNACTACSNPEIVSYYDGKCR